MPTQGNFSDKGLCRLIKTKGEDSLFLLFRLRFPERFGIFPFPLSCHYDNLFNKFPFPWAFICVFDLNAFRKKKKKNSHLLDLFYFHFTFGPFSHVFTSRLVIKIIGPSLEICSMHSMSDFPLHNSPCMRNLLK